MTDKPTLNDLAPYPDDLSEVTAKRLADYNAALGLHEHYLRMKLDGLTDGNAWKVALYNSRTSWAVSLLLRMLSHHAGADVADVVARRLWLCWDDPQDCEEQLREWVSKAGIDPAVLAEMAQGSYENHQELKAHVASLNHPGQGQIPIA